MLIIYRLDTLAIEHCLHVSADNYTDVIDADPERGWIRVEGDYNPGDLAITLVEDQPVAMARMPIAITGPTTAVVGEEIALLGIPEGARCVGPDGEGIMDESQTLEVTFETPGSYRLMFMHDLYYYQEWSVEVTAQ